MTLILITAPETLTNAYGNNEQSVLRDVRTRD